MMRTFERRYVFTGRLVFTTALHIGGGRGTLSPSDSPILLGPDGEPYIPGSSLKGSFRSMVEKLAPSVGLRACGLIDGAACPGAPGEGQRSFQQQREQHGWSESGTVRALGEQLCDTCKLFGSHWMASRMLFDDLVVESWAGVTQIRDGVAIDRDSERARDRLKYDYEVVPPGAAFSFRAILEEPTDADVALAAVGLSELESGYGSVGGLRSRGLGRCQLEELRVYELDLRNLDSRARAERLRRYLLGRTVEQKMELQGTATFMERSISKLLEGMQDAQAIGQ